MAGDHPRGDHLGSYLGRTVIAHIYLARYGPCSLENRFVFFAAGRGHIWRRLCRTGLYGAGSCERLWLAAAGRNGGRSGAGRDDAGAIDHGHAVCRLSSGLSRTSTLFPAYRWDCRCGCHDLGYIRALFPVDICSGAVDRTVAECQMAEGRTGGNHRCCGWRYCQSDPVVCIACVISTGGAGHHGAGGA